MTPFTSFTHLVVTDLTIRSSETTENFPTCARTWHRMEKELYLHTSRQSAWLYVALADEEELTAEDFLIVDVRVGEPPSELSLECSWESRPNGVWLLRRRFSYNADGALTGVDVLFGTYAVEPRPRWKLIDSPLRLNGQEALLPRLSVRYGRATDEPLARRPLRARVDGTFKIVQISDTHMVTGAGVCKDAMDGTGKSLPTSEADPLTVRFIEHTLDIEQPDLVVLTGDQLHHDTPDSQTALFKVVAPIIQRAIPFAAVFGNHDSEGAYALSRQ